MVNLVQSYDHLNSRVESGRCLGISLAQLLKKLEIWMEAEEKLYSYYTFAPPHVQGIIAGQLPPHIAPFATGRSKKSVFIKMHIAHNDYPSRRLLLLLLLLPLSLPLLIQVVTEATISAQTGAFESRKGKAEKTT